MKRNQYIFECDCGKHLTRVSSATTLFQKTLVLFCIVCGKGTTHRRLLPHKERCKRRGCKEPYMVAGYCTNHIIKLMNDVHRRTRKSKLQFGSTPTRKVIEAREK